MKTPTAATAKIAMAYKIILSSIRTTRLSGGVYRECCQSDVLFVTYLNYTSFVIYFTY